MHSAHYPKRAALNRSVLTAQAIGLRAKATPSEELIWQAVRSNKLGVEVRRQVPVAGRFVADFFVPNLRIVIEIDGDYHANRQKADARRDRVLHRLGYRVLRITANQVMADLAGAVKCIQAEMARIE